MLVIEKLLEVMDFQKQGKLNYDPHHIISYRKQLDKNKPFDHQIVEGLDKIANLSNFEENTETSEIREMTEYDTPNVEQWKIMDKFGKPKYMYIHEDKCCSFGKLSVRNASQLWSLL